MNQSAGAPIVLTAPLTESINHAGFFIQMSLASIPGWMEWVIDKKYPTWREVPTIADGRAGTAPAGVRVLEAVLAREFGADHVVVCYLFRRALAGEPLPRTLDAHHPHDADQLVVPHTRTSFGVVEMTVRPDWRQAIAGARVGPAVAGTRVLRMTAV
jgi:hypothetical protein